MVGLYERLLNTLLHERIESDQSRNYFYGERPLKADEAARMLSIYVAGLLQPVLAKRLSERGDVKDAVRLVNDIVLAVADALPSGTNNLLDVEAKILTAVLERRSRADAELEKELERIYPVTGLTRSSLFSGSTRGPSLAGELAREILSADRIDWLVSFVRESGIKPLLASLDEATQRGAKFRLLTTTYMAVSDFAAIKRLAQFPNTEVRISYDENTTRLHAKAYLFYRNSGSHTVYVGSSNLSAAAIGAGMEWNLKTTAAEVPELVDATMREFEQYWQMPALFEPFDPNSAADNERLEKALQKPLLVFPGEADNAETADGLPNAPYTLFDYQEDVLRKIDEQRTLFNSNKNLVVAATGTGKTVIVANDFKRWREKHPEARLLFLVHREEILRQARNTFRRVLGEEDFGELWFNGVQPTEYKAVFASVATMQSRLGERGPGHENLPFGAETFDYIVIDEAHHSAADGYLRILSFFKPKVLVGLTATPERLDQHDIKQYFDGRFAAEIRLTDAINRGMLVPFTYYGLPDAVDLTQTAWKRGRYDDQDLSYAFIKSDARTTLVLNAVREKLPDFDRGRSLAFCVDKAHANAMADAFKPYHRVSVLTSDNTRQERQAILKALEDGSINCLFVVDILNEGVDIPSVDSVIFLRPTQSLTVFLQQLGRGLRRAKNKLRLNVLDFIARTRKEFDWATRLGALLDAESMSQGDMCAAVRTGYLPLPNGCQIFLEPIARETLAKNIEDHIKYLSRNEKVDQLLEKYGPDAATLRLEDFLYNEGIELDHVYKYQTWTSLKQTIAQRYQGIKRPNVTVNESLRKMIYNRWLVIDDRAYVDFLSSLVARDFDMRFDEATQREYCYLMMLYYDYYETLGRISSLEEMLKNFRSDHALKAELTEVLPLVRDKMTEVPQRETSNLGLLTPLKLHGRYTRAEAMAALGRWSLTTMPDGQSGVSAGTLEAIGSDVKAAGQQAEPVFLMFVTVRKEDMQTHDYLDYAIDPLHFHWQSPKKTHPEGARGKQITDTSRKKLLFVRYRRELEDGRTCPFYYMGPVTLESLEGARPISVVWKMAHAIPAEIFAIQQRLDQESVASESENSETK